MEDEDRKVIFLLAFLINLDGKPPQAVEIFRKVGYSKGPSSSWAEGLVVFGDFVCNLTTRKSIEIHPPQGHDNLNSCKSYYIVFDSSTKEYKILSISKDKKNGFLNLRGAQVLTLGTNLWRHVHSDPDL